MTRYSSERQFNSWGRVKRVPYLIARPRFRDALTSALVPANELDSKLVLAVGLGRSYGDSCLNANGRLIEMTGLDRVISLDCGAGLLRAEAGLSLSAALSLIVPRGLFLPTTPGTRFVTLGGAVANDIHGKNHNSAGTFGCSVTRLGLVRSDGSRLEIGPESNSELFAATVGGLGLTGIIEWAEIRLQSIESSQLDVEIIPLDTLSEFWELAEASSATHEHTIAWIDCTAKARRSGRGIFFRANWSREGGLVVHENRRRLGVPFEAPSWLLNDLTVSIFNRVYYAAQKRKAAGQSQHYASFFHALDGVTHWNRLYGGRGFWQYQCVMPPMTMKDAVSVLLSEIARSGQGSFFTVLKTFGNIASPGLLSFPMEGATLALDFANRGEKTLRLLSRLDAVVREAKGRLYPAKDGRMPAELFREGYPAWTEFAKHVDPMFSSDFWRRVSE